MNPVSPLTYYLRHKRSALLQIALISLATAGLFILVAVLDAIPMRGHVSYLTKVGRVVPTGDGLDPGIVAQIETHPDVERVVPENGLSVSLPSLLGTDSQRLLGVSPPDARYLMEHCGVRLKEGRMFEPRTNQFVISEEIARALDLQLGDEIERTVDQNHYNAVPAPLMLVGILEGDPTVNAGPTVRLGFVSAEYLEGHERYAPRATGLLVVARQGRKDIVDSFLETTVSSKYAEVETFAQLVEFLKAARIGIYVVFGVVNSVVAVAVAFVVGIINRIAIARRLSEFGLLHALGRTRTYLTRRLRLETTILAGLGCLVGLGIALAITSWLKNSLFYNLGMELNLRNPAPFFFVLPIPLIVVALTSLSVRRTFARLDAVAIIERGKLSTEHQGDWRQNHRLRRKGEPIASTNPLSSLTFYKRHRRRGILTILSTALMVLGITLPVFLLSAISSAMMPFFGYLEQISVVAPTGSALDPGVVGQIKSHAAVARTVPAIPLGMQMILPPAGETTVPVWGIAEADVPLLLDRFDLHVQQGRLPRPHSNEIILSAAIAANRDLQVGDVIGGESNSHDAPVVDDLPTEMVVSGILSPDRPWVAFASYEYLHSHELTSSRGQRLLIIAREGQKGALDTWLMESLDGTQTRIITHAIEESEYREMTQSMVLTFAALECMIAAVAAVALATLNHIFFTQRREEFGILNAMGRHRRWLMWRAMKETTSAVSVAWVIGAAFCGIGLLIIQRLVYAPRSLTLDFFSPVPWLLTIPVPLAVVLASLGTIALMLHRLDPLAIIERR